MKVFCNAGSTTTNMVGKFGSIPVFYNANSIANVLLLHGISKIHRVMSVSVHMPSGIVEFKPTKKGLHYLNLAASDSPAPSPPTTRATPNGTSSRLARPIIYRACLGTRLIEVSKVWYMNS